MSESARRTRIRVLVVEDSAVVRELLVHLLDADPAMQVVGTATNGEEALEAVRTKKPDIVTMDYHMPKMNGLAATRKLMQTYPVPIVIVSGSSARDEVAAAFQLLEAGAIAIVEKPPGIGHPHHAAAAKELAQTVRLMSEVKVVKRWPKRAAADSPPLARAASAMEPARGDIKLVAIGASTGGPVVLKAILSALPRHLPVPVLIVQHIAAGFTEGLAAWLSQASGFPVRIAAHGEYPVPGHAYLAPDGVHLQLAHDGSIALSEEAPENGHRPSVSHLFRSVAATLGRNAAGVLLSGMGSDGATELKTMKDRGALTIAQDQASSAVHGMPGAAIALGAAVHILSPGDIAATLAGLSGTQEAIGEEQ